MCSPFNSNYKCIFCLNTFSAKDDAFNDYLKCIKRLNNHGSDTDRTIEDWIKGFLLLQENIILNGADLPYLKSCPICSELASLGGIIDVDVKQKTLDPSDLLTHLHKHLVYYPIECNECKKMSRLKKAFTHATMEKHCRNEHPESKLKYSAMINLKRIRILERFIEEISRYCSPDDEKYSPLTPKSSCSSESSDLGFDEHVDDNFEKESDPRPPSVELVLREPISANIFVEKKEFQDFLDLSFIEQFNYSLSNGRTFLLKKFTVALEKVDKETLLKYNIGSPTTNEDHKTDDNVYETPVYSPRRTRSSSFNFPPCITFEKDKTSLGSESITPNNNKTVAPSNSNHTANRKIKKKRPSYPTFSNTKKKKKKTPNQGTPQLAIAQSSTPKIKSSNKTQKTEILKSKKVSEDSLKTPSRAISPVRTVNLRSSSINLNSNPPESPESSHPKDELSELLEKCLTNDYLYEDDLNDDDLRDIINLPLDEIEIDDLQDRFILEYQFE